MTEHRCNDCGHQWTPEPDEPDDDWAPIDLAPIAAAIRNGTHQPALPEILHVDGTLPLFYRGRTNSIFGESGSGKSWVALAAVAETVRNGGRVGYCDWEDNPAGVAERLVNIGLTDQEISRVDYRNPVTGIGRGPAAYNNCGTYDLIVIDSTGEAMATSGINSNDDGDVATWMALAKAFVRLPGQPAVLLLDHIPKDTEAPKGYAIGSQRKRAAISGASYRLDVIKEPAKGHDGKWKLTTAKDRPGNRARGSIAAEIDITTTDTGALQLRFHQSEAQAAHDRGERFRPTVLMDRVSRFLEQTDECSQRSIIAGVDGRQEGIRLALQVLADEHYITVTNGARGALIYRSERPYRDDQPVDNSPNDDRIPPRPTASHRIPDTVAKAVDCVPSSDPPPSGGSHGTRSAAGNGTHSNNGDRVHPVENSDPEFGPYDPFPAEVP